MTLEFRDHQVLVISPGSSTTQAQLGIGDSLLPPSFEIPTVVYKDSETNKFRMTPSPTSTPLHPVVKGQVQDVQALCYLLKTIYRSSKTLDGLNPALYIVTSTLWSRRSLELITQYCFEEIKVPALALYDQSVCTAYAFLASDCLVVDVGYEKTEIGVVLGSEIRRQCSKVVFFGGQSINNRLKQTLNLNDEQIEDLKRSEIFQVLSADQSKHADGIKKLIDEEEGVVDIAAIVASGRTREILDSREKSKNGAHEDAIPGTDKEENSFTDRHGEKLNVGLERFTGCDDLLNSIVDAIGDVVYLLTPRELDHIFHNFIITGKGALPNGFKSRLVELVEAKYLIKPTPSTSLSTTNTEEDPVSQMPVKLTVSKLPDHFPEWKNRKWEDILFLGAQIGAKQVFTAGIEGVFVTRQDYNEIGPTCVGDILF